jgi:hypothetical protein
MTFLRFGAGMIDETWTVGDLKILRQKFPNLDVELIAEFLGIWPKDIRSWDIFPDDAKLPPIHFSKLNDLKKKVEKNWNRLKLEIFLNSYKIKQVDLAEVLEIDPSTVNVWLKKGEIDTVPQKYWKKLNIFENKCAELSKTPNVEYSLSENKQKRLAAMGAASALGLATFGAAGAIASMMGSYSDQRECPYCAEIIKKKAILCKHCRSKVDPIT